MFRQVGMELTRMNKRFGITWYFKSTTLKSHNRCFFKQKKRNGLLFWHFNQTTDIPIIFVEWARIMWCWFHSICAFFGLFEKWGESTYKTVKWENTQTSEARSAANHCHWVWNLSVFKSSVLNLKCSRSFMSKIKCHQKLLRLLSFGQQSRLPSKFLKFVSPWSKNKQKSVPETPRKIAIYFPFHKVDKQWTQNIDIMGEK